MSLGRCDCVGPWMSHWKAADFKLWEANTSSKIVPHTLNIVPVGLDFQKKREVI